MLLRESVSKKHYSKFSRRFKESTRLHHSDVMDNQNSTHAGKRLIDYQLSEFCYRKCVRFIDDGQDKKNLKMGKFN
jgi:hypothetical protein